MNFLFTHTPLMYFIQSFWRDEAFSYVLANKSIFQILFYTARDFNPPFYYILLHVWMILFGHSEIAIRTLSLIFFWGTIYIAFDFMHFVLKISYKRAVPYMLLMILNPIVLYYGFEGRMYSMIAFFAALSYFALHTNRKKLHLLALILGIFTHYFMVFIFISQIVFLLITKKKNESFVSVFKNYLISGFVFLPWLLYVFFQKTGSSGSFWIPAMEIKNILIIPGIMYTGMEPFLDYFLEKKAIYTFSMVALSLIIVGISAIGYIKINKTDIKKRTLFISLLIWALLPPLFTYIVSFAKPIFLPRYLIASSVGMLLLIAYSLEHIEQKAKLILATVLVLLTLHHLRLQIVYRKKVNISRTFQEINDLARKNDVVYVTSDLDFFTAQYYFGDNRVYIYNKKYKEIPDYVGKTLIPEEKITTALPYYPQKAFIIDGQGNYDITAAY